MASTTGQCIAEHDSMCQCCVCGLVSISLSFTWDFNYMFMVFSFLTCPICLRSSLKSMQKKIYILLFIFGITTHGQSEWKPHLQHNLMGHLVANVWCLRIMSKMPLHLRSCYCLGLDIFTLSSLYRRLWHTWYDCSYTWLSIRCLRQRAEMLFQLHYDCLLL